MVGAGRETLSSDRLQERCLHVPRVRSIRLQGVKHRALQDAAICTSCSSSSLEPKLQTSLGAERSANSGNLPENGLL